MPTIKQIKGVKMMLENLGSGNPKSQGEILREVGYSEAIVKNPKMITESKGWKELLPENLLAKAERNLDKFLDAEDKPQIQADITKFVAERLGKSKYSQRHENINVELPIPLLDNLKQ